MTTRIIKIKPAQQLFSITWMLGANCNYDCMYCPPDLHDTSKPHDLETLKKVWINIYNKSVDKNLRYKISFTGGEVTANKSFLPLIQWLRATYPEIEMILITTNGSASISYYKKLAELVESISFSTHSEFMNEKEFFTKVNTINQIMIRPKKSLHVNVMNEYWNKQRTSLYCNWLTAHNISYSVNENDYSFKIRDYNINKGKLNFDKL